MVVPTGIEPVTLGLWVLRSNQLSYGTTVWRKGQDSNLRSVNLPVFKTGAINHSATLPFTIITENILPVKWKIALRKLIKNQQKESTKLQQKKEPDKVPTKRSPRRLLLKLSCVSEDVNYVIEIIYGIQ